MYLSVKKIHVPPETPGDEPTDDYILVLGDLIDSREINRRYQAIVEREHENRFNVEFKLESDPINVQMSRGVSASQVFEIENSIVKPIPNIMDLSVIKIKNIGYNMYISTDIKKNLDGTDEHDEGEGSGEEEEDLFDESIGQEAGFERTETGKSDTHGANEGNESLLDIHDLTDKPDLERDDKLLSASPAKSIPRN